MPGVPAFLHSLPEERSRVEFDSDAAGFRQMAGRPPFANDGANDRQSHLAGVFRHWVGRHARRPRHAGVPPSHPELFDWLAVDLMDHGWDLKHLHHLIVSSATYRQLSTVTPDLLARDPANRLFARGSAISRRCRDRPRHRPFGQWAANRKDRRTERASARTTVSVSRRPQASDLRPGTSTPAPTATGGLSTLLAFEAYLIRLCKTSMHRSVKSRALAVHGRTRRCRH